MRLTQRQEEALAFIRLEVSAGKPFPTAKDIALHFGLGSESIAGIDILLSLAAKRRIRIKHRRRWGKSRCYDWMMV